MLFFLVQKSKINKAFWGAGLKVYIKFEFGNTCATRCKFLGTQLKILGAQLAMLGASISKEEVKSLTVPRIYVIFI